MNKRGIIMKIAIIGYGKMGKLLHSLCEKSGHELACIIDPKQAEYNKEICLENLNGAELALEFTQPQALVSRVEALAKCGVNIVIGTSGWYEQLEQVAAIAEKYNVGIIYGANFSIGMNIYFQTISYLAKMMDKIPDYDIYAYEEHHNEKKDKPSGTAKYITSLIRKEYSDLRDDFDFEAIRAGRKPGTHLVGFDGDYDFIELKHLARDRAAFVSGAVKSLAWINGKKGFYNFSDYFREIFALDE